MVDYRAVIAFILYFVFTLAAQSQVHDIPANLYPKGWVHGASDAYFPTLESPKYYANVIEASGTTGIEVRDDSGNLIATFADTGEIRSASVTINGVTVNVVSPTDNYVLTYDAATGTIALEAAGSGVESFETLTDSGIVTPASNEIIVNNGAGSWVNLPKASIQDREYTMAGTVTGTFTDGQLLGTVPFADTVLFDTASMANAYAYSATATTAAATVTWRFNEAPQDIWMHFYFPASATEAVITVTDTTFVATNRTAIIAPNPADSTLDTIGFVIKGTKQ